MENYKGRWESVDGGEEGTEYVTIVGVRGGMALTNQLPIPKEIPLSELGSKYKRAESMGANPFGGADINLGSILAQEGIKVTPPVVEEKVTISDVVPTPISKPPTKVVKDLTPQQQLVQSAIDVSISNNTEPQSLTVPISIEVNFDIDKIVQSCEAMGLSVNDIAPILVDNINIDLESVSKHLSEKLANIISE